MNVSDDKCATAILQTMTAKTHAGNSYEELAERCKDISNIEVNITGNPYHDARYAGCMRQVVSVDDWVEAIRSLSDEGNDGLLDRVNMQECYQNMKKQMML